MEDIIIDVQNITKIYDQMTDNPVKSLDNVSLQVKRGEFIAIMGPSGSGKTTLINCLSTIDQPTKGEILLYGKSLFDLTDKEICQFRNKEIGYIFQDYQLLDYLTIEENIAFPMSMNNISIRKIKEKIQRISHKIGVEDILKKYPAECSGGQKQRVAIARALITEPHIIIADEPTGNLDSQKTIELMNILKKLNEEEQKTIVLVTHDNVVASFSNKLLYLKDGKIISHIDRLDKSQKAYFECINNTTNRNNFLM